MSVVSKVTTAENVLDKSRSSVSHVVSWATIKIFAKTIKGGAIYVRKFDTPKTAVFRI